MKIVIPKSKRGLPAGWRPKNRKGNWRQRKIENPTAGSPIRTWAEMSEHERQAIKERLGVTVNGK